MYHFGKQYFHKKMLEFGYQEIIDAASAEKVDERYGEFKDVS